MTTILFPGQGSQYLGMAKDFYDNFDSAKNIFNVIEDAAQIKIKDIIFNDNQNLLNITQYTQLSIFCASMAIYQVFKEEVDINSKDINIMFGHSLGEYSALAASEAISIKECAKLLKIRGELMQNSYEPNLSGMVAILGLDCQSVEKIISDNNLKVEIANDNSPTQVVISGVKKYLDESEEIFRDMGAKKFIKLNVSAAFHSTIMLKASEDMKYHLDKTSFYTPSASIISNYNADMSNDIEIISKNLALQMSNRVRWVESIKLLERMNEKVLIEIGPGKVLSNLIKRISKYFSTHNFEFITDIKKLNDEL